jgi:NAD(P)-dependent dehydrogenase (short-subunit alcohol dehydrogenase family)
MGRLSGKTALITGSSRGLGAAIALGFAREGAAIAVNYRTRQDKADEVVGTIKVAGGKAIAIRADCTVEADVRHMVDEVVETFGEIRILVNNSGILSRGRIADMSLAVWDEMIASHLRSHFLATKYCLQRSMLALQPFAGERVAAKIINMGSGLVNRGGRDATEQVHYMTAKAAIAGFTRGLAGELAPNITVNAIAPGIHQTDMLMASKPSDELLRQLGNLFLLGLPRNEDVVAAAVFLASTDADHMTAETITTNGGSS